MTIRSLMEQKEPLDKYLYLRNLQQKDSQSYYSLLLGHTETVLPYIYTPTVGEACQRYHELNIQPVGLYISLHDRGRILQKLLRWQQHRQMQPSQRVSSVRVVVVTDGERILGLGDLGANGMGISEGKISLYTAAAGVDPALCLPVCLDVGTNNKKLREHPQYMGLRQQRATGEEYDSFISEFMTSIKHLRNHVLMQFEDFGNTNAFRLLDQYRTSHCCFNDDIQGTAATCLAALLAALRTIAPGRTLKGQRMLFLGAGEAGTGIGELIAYCLHRREGLSMKEAREHCFFMDSKGLVTAKRAAAGELQHHKLPFAHDVTPCKDLLTAIETLKPSVLIGVSAVPNTFTEEVVRAMSRINQRPIIFPLSNPTSMSECTFGQAYEWSNGRVVFASGSPFPPIKRSNGSKVHPAQANNAYIFPAVGHAAVLTQCQAVTDEMFLIAAECLGAMSSPAELEDGWLFPAFSNIKSVSSRIMAQLCEHIIDQGLGSKPAGARKVHSREEWEEFIRSSMWPVGKGHEVHRSRL